MRWLSAAAALSLIVNVAAAGEVKVGDAAPDFELKGSDGKTYKLSEFKGKKAVVVAWYPKAFTGGCTKECKSFAESTPKLSKLPLAFFTASVDPVDQNTKFAESVGAHYPILSDPDKTVAKEYGVLSARGFANRWTYYIDKEGVVRYVDKKVNAAKHGEDVLAKAKELGFDK